MEVELHSKKAQSGTLRKNAADLDSLIDFNATKAAEKRAEAHSMAKECEKIRAEEVLRREAITKAVSKADLQCQEEQKLRESIAELKEKREIHTAEVKQTLDGKESNISAMEVEIISAIDELSFVEKESAKHKARVSVARKMMLDEVASAKVVADLVKAAFERAQKAASDFTSLPDEALALQINPSNEAKQDIINDAVHQREKMIESKLRV
jgi:hypothetical protein